MSDVIIIGGGPAGSTLGSYLSQLGIDNVILEKALHPRSHVGESLVTSTTRIFKDIDFLETMEREGFVRKYGAAWHPPSRKGEFVIEFREFPQEGVEQDYTYHVDRGKFDLLLLKHAEKLGSKIYQGVQVQEVLFENDRATGVRFKMGKEDVRMQAKVIVDATGRAALLGRQLRIKKKDPIFNQYAVHSWFENVERGHGRSADFIHIYFLQVERGWVWQIPITDKITSIGVVAEKNVFRRLKMNNETYFQSHIQSNPALADAMRNAKRINDYKAEGDYSYSMDTFVGNGFLMVGDAARFVDPIFSSGISVALSSAKFASETIKRCFEIDDFSKAALMPYSSRLKSGVQVWYEFIRLYYKLLHVFTYFIQKKQFRLQILQLLQGEVYDRKEVPVLKAMRDFVKAAEESESHLFKEHVTSVPID